MIDWFGKRSNIWNFLIWKINKFLNLYIFLILPFVNQYFAIWKLLNILSIQIISKKWKNKFDNKTNE